MHAPTHVTPTLYNCCATSCYFCKAALNDCKSEVIIILIINTGQTAYADEPRGRSIPQKELNSIATYVYNYKYNKLYSLLAVLTYTVLACSYKVGFYNMLQL